MTATPPNHNSRQNPNLRQPGIFMRTPWWLLTFIILSIIFGGIIATDNNYRIIAKALVKGIPVTLFVTFVAFGLSTLLGLLIALLHFSKIRIVREIGTFYVELFRAVPILVLLLYIAFVAAPMMVAGWNWMFTWPIYFGWMDAAITRDFSFTWRAIIALTFSYSAFIAEVFRAGIQSVDKGQNEAAKSIGLGPIDTFRLVVFPQAIRNILPPLGNDFVAMIKDSALVAFLGVPYITQLGKLYSTSTFKFFETYNVVAFIYLVIIITLSLGVRAIERRLKKSDAR